MTDAYTRWAEKSEKQWAERAKLFCPHCNTHIDEHPASRCLDAWVLCTINDKEFKPLEGRVMWDAEKQEAIDFQPHFGYPVGHVSAPKYSTSIAAAWQVLEKLSADGYSYQVLEHSDPKRGDCLCELWKDFYRWNVNHQDTVPLAICKATIKSMVKDD